MVTSGVAEGPVLGLEKESDLPSASLQLSGMEGDGDVCCWSTQGQGYHLKGPRQEKRADKKLIKFSQDKFLVLCQRHRTGHRLGSPDWEQLCGEGPGDPGGQLVDTKPANPWQ